MSSTRGFIALLVRHSSVFVIAAIAAIIGDIVVFYNSKNLNCIGALSLFLRSVHAFFQLFHVNEKST